METSPDDTQREFGPTDSTDTGSEEHPVPLVRPFTSSASGWKPVTHRSFSRGPTRTAASAANSSAASTRSHDWANTGEAPLGKVTGRQRLTTDTEVSTRIEYDTHTAEFVNLTVPQIIATASADVTAAADGGLKRG